MLEMLLERCGKTRAAPQERTGPPMWTKQYLPQFAACVRELSQDPAVQRMHAIRQHVKAVDCYAHSLFVAYLAFCFCKKLGLDARAAARAGLLHDLYLCDWSKTAIGPVERLVIHPRMALDNARRFGLSKLEEDIILTHMWPVTPRALPHYRESALVNLADKLATLAEVTHAYPLLGLRRVLAAV